MTGTPTRTSHGEGGAVGGTPDASADANALVLAEPGRAGVCPCPCEAHDGTAATARGAAFLCVAFTCGAARSPREWVEAARDGPPVHVVDATPGSDAPSSPSGALDDAPAGSGAGTDGVVSVPAAGPSNLTDLGVRFTEALDALEAFDDDTTDDAGGSDAARPGAVARIETDGGAAAGGTAGPVCCLGSLTALLQYVDVKPAYRFLNAALAEVDARGGTAHAHVSPDALDRRTVDTLASLFDLVAEPRPDGSGLAVVRSRRR